MENKKYLIAGAGVLVVVLVVGIVASLRGGDGAGSGDEKAGYRGINDDPIDVALDFYQEWLNRKQVSEVTAETPNPVDSMALSYRMQERLSGFDFAAEGKDPIFCISTLPDGFKSRAIFTQDTKIQRLMYSSNEQERGQALVTLEKHDELWEISDITCSSGEEAPEIGEFSFDAEGMLLKDSLPDTFDKTNWYLVFEKDDTKGFTAPLLISAESMCLEAQAEDVCDTADFYETMKLHVQGQMTEGGVDVKRIEVVGN